MGVILSKTGRSEALGNMSGKIYNMLENIYIQQVAVIVQERAVAF